MDAFDYTDTNEAPPTRNTGEKIWNILTLIVLFATLIVGLVMLNIFINPHSALNPFPPPTLPATIALPTPTDTAIIQLPPTWTPVPTQAPTLTSTPRPSSTPVPILVTPETPTNTPENQITPTPGEFSYVLHRESPHYLNNLFHQDGCNWLGVAGQALTLNESPIIGLFVQLGGTLEGRIVDLLSMTGTAPNYGVGGYEFTLSDKPVESHQTLWIQLMDQEYLPLSDKIYFDTYAACDKNLILINFAQVK